MATTDGRYIVTTATIVFELNLMISGVSPLFTNLSVISKLLLHFSTYCLSRPPSLYVVRFRSISQEV